MVDITLHNAWILEQVNCSFVYLSIKLDVRQYQSCAVSVNRMRRFINAAERGCRNSESLPVGITFKFYSAIKIYSNISSWFVCNIPLSLKGKNRLSMIYKNIFRYILKLSYFKQRSEIMFSIVISYLNFCWIKHCCHFLKEC